MIFKCLNNRNILKHPANMEKIDNFFKQRDHTNRFNNSNVTPPPPYAELFNKNRSKVWTTGNGNTQQGVQKYINGRFYMVTKGEDGGSRLIPLRQPSATLFQYSYNN